jgi:hypothetical protein
MCLLSSPQSRQMRQTGDYANAALFRHAAPRGDIADLGKVWGDRHPRDSAAVRLGCDKGPQSTRFDSLYQGYPVGYLIAWRNPTVKLKDGTPSAGKRTLIDGQQRVTALTSAFRLGSCRAASLT